jgi:hypothetical protein
VIIGLEWLEEVSERGCERSRVQIPPTTTFKNSVKNTV